MEEGGRQRRRRRRKKKQEEEEEEDLVEGEEIVIMLLGTQDALGPLATLGQEKEKKARRGKKIINNWNVHAPKDVTTWWRLCSCAPCPGIARKHWTSLL